MCILEIFFPLVWKKILFSQQQKYMKFGKKYESNSERYQKVDHVFRNKMLQK